MATARKTLSKASLASRFRLSDVSLVSQSCKRFQLPADAPTGILNLGLNITPRRAVRTIRGKQDKGLVISLEVTAEGEEGAKKTKSFELAATYEAFFALIESKATWDDEELSKTELHAFVMQFVPLVADKMNHVFLEMGYRNVRYPYTIDMSDMKAAQVKKAKAERSRPKPIVS